MIYKRKCHNCKRVYQINATVTDSYCPICGHKGIDPTEERFKSEILYSLCVEDVTCCAKMADITRPITEDDYLTIEGMTLPWSETITTILEDNS